MRTIQKILRYKPIEEYNIELLRKAWLYNWTGADGVFFDEIIDKIFEVLQKAEIFNQEKAFQLRKDIQQLVIRHDIDFSFKIWFLRSNRRLSVWLYKLLHKFPFKYKITIAIIVFYAVQFSQIAKQTYFDYKNIMRRSDYYIICVWVILLWFICLYLEQDMYAWMFFSIFFTFIRDILWIKEENKESKKESNEPILDEFFPE